MTVCVCACYSLLFLPTAVQHYLPLSGVKLDIPTLWAHATRPPSVCMCVCVFVCVRVRAYVLLVWLPISPSLHLPFAPFQQRAYQTFQKLLLLFGWASSHLLALHQHDDDACRADCMTDGMTDSMTDCVTGGHHKLHSYSRQQQKSCLMYHFIATSKTRLKTCSIKLKLNYT